MPFNFKIDHHTNANLTHSTFKEDVLLGMLEKFKGTINDEKYGFFHLTDNKEQLVKAKEVYSQFSDRKYFVQVGIGGSALGPQMLLDALKKDNGKEFIFLDNTDADYISDELKKINPKESVFYIVSKSGGTAETLACFSILRKLLLDSGVVEEDFNKYFIFSTDPVKSDLRELANDHGYKALDIPSNIGGRFSVLTSVGLLPALFAGIDIDALFEGANNIKENLLSTDTANNQLLQTAANLAYLLNEEKVPVNQTVIMPYSSKLKTMGNWFVQLWGESLGKFSEETKQNTGLTPIPAYGATDQHAQMQLFMEGPNDKTMFIVEVKNKETNFKLDNNIGKDSATKLNGFTMNQLIEAQLHGTLAALKDRDRNVFHMSIDRNDEAHLGAIILFFESLTAMMGHYLLVDPFNQPGVELGKVFAFKYLSKIK